MQVSIYRPHLHLDIILPHEYYKSVTRWQRKIRTLKLKPSSWQTCAGYTKSIMESLMKSALAKHMGPRKSGSTGQPPAGSGGYSQSQSHLCSSLGRFKKKSACNLYLRNWQSLKFTIYNLIRTKQTMENKKLIK